MSASINKKIVQEAKKAGRKRKRKSPVVYFFDNDAENFKNCPNNVVMIKTPETDGRIFHNMSLISKLRSELLILPMYEQYLVPHVKWMIKADTCTGGLFDIYSGIEKHPVIINDSITFQHNDKILIDFDRTITITEGFLGNGDKNTRLIDLLNLYKSKGFLGSIDDLISVQMGGYKRRLQIKDILNNIIDNVKRKNVIIITNNILKQVIADFMVQLLGRQLKVISTKEIKISKCQYIRSL